GTIKHSRMTGTVSGNYAAAGIARSNRGTIRHCRTDVAVDADHNAGGIASSNQGLIEHVTAGGTVKAHTAMGGGIAAKNLETGTISKSVSYADVYESYSFPEHTDLIVGLNEGTINKTFSFGQMLTGY